MVCTLTVAVVETLLEPELTLGVNAGQRICVCMCARECVSKGLATHKHGFLVYCISTVRNEHTSEWASRGCGCCTPARSSRLLAVLGAAEMILASVTPDRRVFAVNSDDHTLCFFAAALTEVKEPAALGLLVHSNAAQRHGVGGGAEADNVTLSLR